MSDDRDRPAPLPFVLPPPRTGGMWGTATFVGLGIAWSTTWLAVLLGPSTGLLSPLVVVVGLLPVVALLTLLATGLAWTLWPDHRLAPWLTGLTVLTPLAWWGPSWSARPDPTVDDARDLDVMTWNVRRLWGAGPPPRSPGADPGAVTCITDTVAAIAPDILVLQEVTQDDVDTLAGRLDLSCIWGPYRKQHADTVGLAACTRGDRWALGDASRMQGFSSLDWQFASAEIRAEDGRALRLYGVHLTPLLLLHDPVGNAAGAVGRLGDVTAHQGMQAGELEALAVASSLPTVLAGDFNSPRDMPLHVRLREHLVDTWERGASGMRGTVDVLGWWPVRIDYIYASHDVGIGRTRIPQVACSDHRPVVSTLQVPAP